MGNIIVLAILGYIFYYIFKSYSRYTTYSQETFKNFSVSKESITKSDLGLFVAKVAKADGKVHALEAELIGIMFDDISAIFPEPHKTKDILKQIFNEEKNNFDNLEEVAYMLGQSILKDKSKQQQFMGFLIQLAFIDGEVSKNEDEILQTIAASFEFDPNAYHAIFEQFEKIMSNTHPKANIDDAYKVLGVSKDDELNTIKKAYRKLIRLYHPDIIKSQGKDEAYMQEATAKTQEINQAYEMIKNSKK